MFTRKNPFEDQRMLLSKRPVKSILDVGANIGDTTAIYRSMFPQAVIYGFEPFPPAFDRYGQRFEKDCLIRPFQLAVAGGAGTARLYVNQNNVTNSCLPAAREGRNWVDSVGDLDSVTSLQVPSTTLDDFCRREKIDEIQILKMDIQGAELCTLESATERLSRGSILLIYTELLFVRLYDGQAFFHEIAAFLSQYGYMLFDLYNGSYSDGGKLKWADGLFLSPQLNSCQIDVKQSVDSLSSTLQRCKSANSMRDHVAQPAGCGGKTAVPFQSGNPAAGRGQKEERDLWDRNLRGRRPAITNEGFDMRGFAGHYYMWPEEYSLLSKYVDLTQGDYLEIGSMCGIIAMSLAVKYRKRNFYCVDAFCAGHATIAGNKEAFLQNLQNHDLTNVILIEEDSRVAVPKIAHRFDIVLIDANHAYEFVIADALNSWPLVVRGGFMAFHDYDCVEETTRAVEDFLGQTGARLVEVASGLAVACKPVRPAEKEKPDEATELKNRIAALEQECFTLNQTKREQETMLQAIQDSVGWHLLDSWRRLRDRVVPPGTFRRKAYDSVIGTLHGTRISAS